MFFITNKRQYKLHTCILGNCELEYKINFRNMRLQETMERNIKVETPHKQAVTIVKYHNQHTRTLKGEMWEDKKVDSNISFKASGRQNEPVVSNRELE